MEVCKREKFFPTPDFYQVNNASLKKIISNSIARHFTRQSICRLKHEYYVNKIFVDLPTILQTLERTQIMQNDVKQYC